jgi:predicted metalloprotease with PDZ domain
MLSRKLLAFGIIALASASTAGAQARTYSIEPSRAFSFSTASEDGDRAVIGVTTSTGSARDTLGVLLSSVSQGGPADKAGIEEGSRVAAINGVNLKLSPADVGDWDMSGALARRFTREMAKVKSGEEVELKVYSGGQTRAVKVKTVTYDALYNTTRRASREMKDRAAVGVSLGSTGSKRDTLGVLLMGIDDEGPAAKAGLEEGNRVQAINGVDLRVGKEDAGDSYMGSSMVRRLQRELEKVKVGDDVTLKVYVGGGRTRDVKVKTVPQSDLKHRSMMIFGGTPMEMPMPPMPPMDQFRGELEDQLERAGRTMERVAPAIRRAITNRIVI